MAPTIRFRSPVFLGDSRLVGSGGGGTINANLILLDGLSASLSGEVGGVSVEPRGGELGDTLECEWPRRPLCLVVRT